MSTDAELVRRATVGEAGAFDELYRRHAQTAWRVAMAVTSNRDDASDAVAEAFTKVLASLPTGRLAEGAPFRPYLIAATRNAAIDVLRRNGRLEPRREVEFIDLTSGSGPSEQLVASEDYGMVAEAFRGLPERWRSVLWLTEVEGLATGEAGAALGVTANHAAQIAFRARNRLRERYLQAHVRNHARPECVFTVERLGAYVGGGLAPRDIAKVDQHLAGCEDCRQRRAEIEDLGPGLRRILLPLPLLLGARAAGIWRLHLASAVGRAGRAAHAGATGGAYGVRRVPRARPAASSLGSAQRALAVATLGLLVAGIWSSFVVNGPNGASTPAASAHPPAASVPPTVRIQLAAAPALPPPASTPVAATPGLGAPALRGAVVEAAVISRAPTNSVASAAPPPAAPAKAAPASSPPKASKPAAPQPVAQVSATAAPSSTSVVSVSAGVGPGSCTGISVAGSGGGCTSTATAPSGSVVSVSTGGSALPTANISLP